MKYSIIYLTCLMAIFVMLILLINNHTDDNVPDEPDTYCYHKVLLDSLDKLRVKHDSIILINDSLANDNKVKAHMILFLNDELLRFVDGDQDRYNAKFQ